MRSPSLLRMCTLLVPIPAAGIWHAISDTWPLRRGPRRGPEHPADWRKICHGLVAWCAIAWASGAFAADAGQATVFLWSEPPGARIYLDGRALEQVTPAEVTVAANRTVPLALQAAGYRTLLQKIGPFKPNETANLEFTLEVAGSPAAPAKGETTPEAGQTTPAKPAPQPAGSGRPTTITLTSEPVGATVFLDQEKLGLTPLLWRKACAPGKLEFRFELPGYEPVKREATVGPDVDQIELTATGFVRRTGVMHLRFLRDGVEYHPPELAQAEAFLDGALVALVDGVVGGAGSRPAELLVLVPGHFPSAISVDLTGKEELEVDVPLTPKGALVNLVVEGPARATLDGLIFQLDGRQVEAEAGMIDVPARREVELVISIKDEASGTAKELVRNGLKLEPGETRKVAVRVPERSVWTAIETAVFVATLRVQPDGRSEIVRFHRDYSTAFQKRYRDAVAGGRLEPGRLAERAVVYEGPLAIRWTHLSDGRNHRYEVRTLRAELVQRGSSRASISSEEASGVKSADVTFWVRLDGTGRPTKVEPRTTDLPPRLLAALRKVVSDLRFERTTADGNGVPIEGLFGMRYVNEN